MGNSCETCVNKDQSKAAKGGQGITYGQGKKRHKTSGRHGDSRRNSMASSDYGGRGGCKFSSFGFPPHLFFL